MYAKLVNNELVIANSSFVTPEGDTIVNFNNNIALMTKYGFKEVVDLKPVFDEKKQYLVLNPYTDNGYNIVITYTVKDLDPPLDEEVKILKDKLLKTEEALKLSEEQQAATQTSLGNTQKELGDTQNELTLVNQKLSITQDALDELLMNMMTLKMNL